MRSPEELNCLPQDYTMKTCHRQDFLIPKSKFLIILLDFSPNPLQIVVFFFLFELLQFQTTLAPFFCSRTLLFRPTCSSQPHLRSLNNLRY